MSAGWPNGMQIVARHLECPKAPLIPPSDRGYVHIAAELETAAPIKPQSAARRQVTTDVVAATGAVAALTGVLRADVFDAVVIPPTNRDGRDLPDGVPYARYDLAVLIECDSPAAARSLREHPCVQAILDRCSGASHVHCTVLRNARRIADVDKNRNGIFLFNYFHKAPQEDGTDATDVLLGVWEYTAGWFTTKANLDNSTLLLPETDSRYAVINHCRWDGLLDIAPHLILRPSIRAFVGGNFTANGIKAMPVLYHLAGTNGVRHSRPVAGWLTVGIGILHTLVTLPQIVLVAPYVVGRGLWGGVATEMPPPMEAMPAIAVLFSFVSGALLLLLGGMMIRLHQANTLSPAWLGPALLVTGLLGGILLPASGFWLVAGLGLWMTARRR